MHYKGILVKRRPLIIDFITHRAKGTSLFSQIYLRGDFFDQWRRGEKTPRLLALLEHEWTHATRGRKHGSLQLLFRYWLSPHTRFEEELLATEAEMRVLNSYGEQFDVADRARTLSSWLYLWCVPYEEAKERLTMLWNSI